MRDVLEPSTRSVSLRRDYNRRYYLLNKRKILAQSRLYYQTHLEKFREYDHRRYTTNLYGCKDKQRAAVQTPEARFKAYKYRAQKIEVEFSLTFEQFKVFVGQPCFYCGGQPEKIRMGVDRADNSRGYVVENCVPCCSRCNIAKNTKSTDEFIQMCREVAAHHA